MSKKASGIFLIVFLVCMFALASKIQLAKAQSTTIYINSDGRVTPSSAPISTVDDVTYTFTGNITYPTYNGIVVERSNIVINGNGYTVLGNNSGNLNDQSIGLNLTDTSNITIENANIENFQNGIYLSGSNNNIIRANNATANGLDGIWLNSSSSYNTVSENNATANLSCGIDLIGSSNNTVSADTATANSYFGIVLTHSSNNTISGNTATANNDSGIWLNYYSNSNIVSGNNATANLDGISLEYSSNNNTVSGNNATANSFAGIYLESSSNNEIYHNDFVNNKLQVYSSNSTNVWDNGYYSGGNYWSDYQTKYPNATENDSSGIWNTPYVIDANNTDYFPLVNQVTVVPEFQSFMLLPLFMTATLVAVAIHRKKLSKT